ncbi:MAG: 4-hydroxy-tetrahydrodipicolinate synthase [Bacteroidota bacterium]
MSIKLRGTAPALITPMDEKLAVDFEALKNMIDFNIHSGVNYLVMLGTTGESATCSEKEKVQILETTKEHINGRVPVVLGLGGNCTNITLDAFPNYNFEGVSAILSVSPYYNKPSQEGIYWHYISIADKSPVPLIIYNVPGRTGSNITAETTLKLAEHPNIIAIKEASGDLVQCMEIIKNKPENFSLISGDDLLAVPMISIGAEGVISVLTNAFPKEFSSMIKHALEGNFEKATEILVKFLSINNLMYEESNPVGVKHALKILRKCDHHVRQPLVPASENLQQRILKSISAFK